MAGIGFELRKLLNRDSYLGTPQTYTFAGLLGAGPWVLSVTSIFSIGILSATLGTSSTVTVEYLVSVTNLVAAWLILNGFLQLMFTRFVVDRHFEDRTKIILPNLLGAITLTTVVSGGLGLLVVVYLFEANLAYRALMLASFVTLSNLWLLVVFVTGMKHYRALLWIFFIAYSITVVLSLALAGLGREGLLAGFFVGHMILVFLLLGLIIYLYPSTKLIGYDFLRRDQSFYILSFAGFFFNLGLWADKIVFWVDPETSEVVIGPLRASVVYDVPVFLAYFAIIPGMAVFLMKIETDFAEEYDNFYDAVRGGGSLEEIERFKDRMVSAVREGIYGIFRVQGLTTALAVVFAPALLSMLGVPGIYAFLFRVEIVGVGALVLLLAILNVFFYLDRKGIALFITASFAMINFALSYISLLLGPAFYGYGFAAAAVLSSIIGLVLLAWKLDRLEFETFMFQG
jgi:uncharacterized membrane protein